MILHRALPLACMLLAAAPAATANGLGDFDAPAGLSGFERPPNLNRASGFNRTVQRAPGVGATATALANSVSVQQSGRGNTLVLTVDQVNTGTVAAGASLNGTLDLD